MGWEGGGAACCTSFTGRQASSLQCCLLLLPCSLQTAQFSSAAAYQAPTPHCSVLTRVHAAYAATKERAERAEAALDMSQATLAQERDSAAAYKVGRVAGQCCCLGLAVGAWTCAYLPHLLNELKDPKQ